MKHLYKKLSSLTLFLVCFTASADSFFPIIPKFTIRSQGANALRRLIQSVEFMNLYDICVLNGTVTITPEYTGSIRTNDIVKCLFGGPLCGSCDQLKVQGSRVADRDRDALLADYFYLPTDFDSTISVRPNIQNFLVDFFGYIGFDNWASGLYAWIQSPLTWTKWNLNFCEQVQAPGELAYLAGYFSPDVIERENLLPDFSSYIRGYAPQAVTQEDITITFDGLTCAQIPCGPHTKTALSEIRLALGWNFLLCRDYHLGVNLQASAPTGNNPDGRFLFAPQNGNDHHWELGVGIDGHALLWQSDCEDAHFGFYLDANLTHMFKNKQTRCFDLCGKPLSRYMLAERMDAPNNDQELQSATDNAIFPTTKFNNEFAPVANITMRSVDVSIGIQADIVFMFHYINKNWCWDIGYNLWARSSERITRNDDHEFAANTWALKGDAQMFGFDTAVGSQARALSATMSEATIHGGDNIGTAGVTPGSVTESIDIKNLGIDNATPAAFNGNDLSTQPAPAPFSAINTSIPPIFITESDINYAGIKSLSNKLFTHFGYTWNDLCYNPYVGLGFEVEFVEPNQIICDDSCNPCNKCNDDCSTLNGYTVRCGLSQWGVWIRGGLAFN